MEIEQFVEDDVQVVALNGRLDQLSAPEVEHVFTALPVSGSTRVLIDMSRVEYISSGGLRVILMLSKTIKRLQGALGLCGLNPFVKEVFDMSGLTSLFDIHPGRAEGLDALRVPGAPPDEGRADPS